MNDDMQRIRMILKFLPRYGMSISDFAEENHLSKQTLYNCQSGQNLSKHMQYFILNKLIEYNPNLVNDAIAYYNSMYSNGNNNETKLDSYLQ